MPPMLMTCIFMIVKQLESFVVQDSYNILLKESVHFKINPNVNNNEQAVAFRTKIDDSNKFDSLNRLVKQELAKDSKRLIAHTVQEFQFRKELFEMKKTKDVLIFFSTPSLSMNTGYTSDQKVTKDGDDNYDYNYLNSEDYVEQLNKRFSNKTYKINKDKQKSSRSIFKQVDLYKKEKNYMTELIKTDAIKKYERIKNKIETKISLKKSILQRFSHFIKICFIVYILLALPMWFTRGWCCCCLTCKLFKPRSTIEEAKKYLLQYPPGVLNTQKIVIQYEPSGREKEVYEEFEHYLRTL